MPINKSAKGRRKEYKSIALLEALGFYCTRAAGSKGLFDIIGVNENEVILLQVKSNKWPTKKELAAMESLVVPSNVKKLIHCWLDRCLKPKVRQL